MPSTQSKIFYSLLRTIKAKKFINKAVEKHKRTKQPFFSESERKKHSILRTKIDDQEVSIMGKDRKGLCHVIYFHGGMYVAEGNTAHKRWLITLFNRTDCKITYIDYPLAPEHTYLETIEMVVKVYQFLSRQTPQDEFVLMGDSAGGGLALVLGQYVRDHGFEHRPVKLILYSPWVRLDMGNNPVLEKMVPKDMILDLDLLQKSANCYARGSDLTQPYLSPYYGSCEGLGDIHVFYGSDEILAPDIDLLKKECEPENIQADFYCFEGMSHDFQLFTFLPESQDVLEKTIEIIKK